VNSLAQAMNIHQSTASNLVRQLARRGLVRVDKSSVDRRSVHLHLEAAGEALLLASPGPYAGVLPDALQKLPADTLVQLHRNLGEVIRALAADESAAGIPLADL
jgi:DNA-binding MarR family transcriptional regulator